MTLGSPPHTWRIPVPFLWGVTAARITSTYVENTLYLNIFFRSIKDHLHIRGEYSDTVPAVFFGTGSPPHTWRILHLQLKSRKEVRITSTYVENTLLVSLFQFLFQDHLHIRGEYICWCASRNVKMGSPPHTWRIQLDHFGMTLSGGITSTYVENTPWHLMR